MVQGMHIPMKPSQRWLCIDPEGPSEGMHSTKEFITNVCLESQPKITNHNASCKSVPLAPWIKEWDFYTQPPSNEHNLAEGIHDHTIKYQTP